jgi:hypothetical protein
MAIWYMYFVVIWYIFLVLVFWTKKNLATLPRSMYCQKHFTAQKRTHFLRMPSSPARIQGKCVVFPGANPTTLSYNARAVKNYNAASRLARFENENTLFCLGKRSSLLHTTPAL